MARVGILGGTFNPPHVGHLIMAQEAWTQLGLDRVVLMPVHTPPHKHVTADPGAAVRAQLCRLAAGDDPRLAVSTLEVDRPGPSYTVDTLRAIHADAPEDELTFIVGGDVAAGLPSWREPHAVLELATLAVAERQGAPRQDVIERVAEVGGADRVRFFDMPRIDVSSSAIRRRVAAGQPVRYLVPDPVAAAIAAQRLYAATTSPERSTVPA